MSNANIDSVQRIYEAFGAGDVETILGLLSDDAPAEDRLHPHGVDVLLPVRVGQHAGLLVLDRHRPADHARDHVGQAEQVAGARTAVDQRLRDVRELTPRH